jgi:primary-amine oxidase
MRRRGISDFSKVFVEYLPSGYFGNPDEEGRRIGRAFSFYRGDAVNFYARPIEGVVAVVDLASGQVLKVTDTGVVPVSKENADLDPKSIGKQRPAPKPLLSSQPEGASFEVSGHEVRWQNWRFRFGFTPREGLVVYNVGYEQDGKVRSILYRGSLSELKLIYADPSPSWYFFNPFDEGEVGIGVFTGSLQPGADVPLSAFFFDVASVSETGEISEIPRAIALYERDGGILWKHNEFDGGRNESRRARELVMTSISSIGNYDYGFNWIFHQDGVLEMEVQLTGIVEPQGIDPATPPGQMMKHAQRVARDIAAVDHQHFFNFRLDMDVDGAEGNSVVEMNVEAVPASEAKPYGRAFTVTEKHLKTEQEAKRQVNFASNRSWKIMNPSSKNGLGEPTGYMLMAGENSVPHIAPDSFVRKGAGFIDQHLWVTPYDPAQRYATGSYPYGRKQSDGLPEWTSANRSIDRKDVVVWYTLGVTHVPRPEEWPVMNVHTAGFKLMPVGFFDRNPALDVPPESTK